MLYRKNCKNINYNDTYNIDSMSIVEIYRDTN